MKPCAVEGCDQPRVVTERRAYFRCRAHLRESKRRSIARNPEKYRATTRAYNKRYEQEHPRDRRTYNRAYYAANYDRLREQQNEYSRVWVRANRSKKRAQFQTRRARELAAFIEYVDHAVVWERDGGKCGICGKLTDPVLWHLDHIVPLARGGTHEYANVQVSHPTCNKSKGTRLVGS